MRLARVVSNAKSTRRAARILRRAIMTRPAWRAAASGWKAEIPRAMMSALMNS